jgi:hypothetical protein
MSKSSLQAVLDRQMQSATEPMVPPRPAARMRAPAPNRQVEAEDNPDRQAARPSRQGKRLVAGHFDPKIAKQLRLLAAEEDTTIQALLEEALDLLFVKKGRGAGASRRI